MSKVLTRCVLARRALTKQALTRQTLARCAPVKQTLTRRESIKVAAAFSGAAVAWSLAGCTSNDTVEDAATGSATTVASSSMAVAWTSNQGDYSLDPAHNYMGWQGSYLGIYEQLWRINAEFEPEPFLAQSATSSDGGTTWEIQLRDGITFQNGRPLDAEAVQLSLERSIARNVRCAAALDIAHMDAFDNTLSITLGTQNPFFINELCEPVCSIIDVASGTGDELPVGTGPYQLQSIDANGNAELVAYEGYWQGTPATSQVSAYYLTDDTSKINALRSGEVSAVMNVGAEYLALFEGVSDYALNQTNQARAHMLYFNMQSEYMADELVREALCCCIDRESYVASIYADAAEAALGTFPEAGGWSDGVTQTDYDLERARELLEAAGFAKDAEGYFARDGERLSLRLVTYEANAALPRICEVLSSTLSQLGVESTIELAEQISARLGDGSWDVATMAYSTLPTGNPVSYLAAVMESSGTANYGGYVNSEVDALIAELRVAADEERQHDLVREIQQIALGEHAYCYIAHALVNDISSACVHNLAMQGQTDWLNHEMYVEQ